MTEKSGYPAHIRIEGDLKQIQWVEDHCKNTASNAEKALEKIGLSHTAYIAGLLHDLGKMKEEYKEYLVRAVRGENVRRGSVNHTFAGVKYVMERYHSAEDPFQRLTAELISFAVGAHHGLFDCVGDTYKHGLYVRENWDDCDYAKTIKAFLATTISQDHLDERMCLAEREIREKFTFIQEMAAGNETMTMFYIGLLARMLLSSVIDGDRKDTASFMADNSPELQNSDRKQMWTQCLQHIEAKLALFPGERPIDQARKRISQLCRDSAGKKSGIYYLNVPTGAGKTLSALRFAAACAGENGKDRIIFTFPLLSILEQNADVIRSFVQDDTLILEHHSNVVHTEELKEEIQKAELLTESWSAPMVITTLVQLLNTLFSGKTSSIRRFQALCNSVIVIDEVQTVPTKMLSLFHLAINFLANICNATVVLCSATQPGQEKVEYRYYREPEPLVPYDKELWKIFRRTELKVAPKHTEEEIPGYLLEALEDTDSLLVVCNKKSEAEHIYRALQDCGAACFHLSAGMCVSHRREILKQLKDGLKAAGERKVICISTQVMEAGVDISFGKAIRFLAGMDSVIQTAGRCNRNGENDTLASVYILECVDEKLKGLPDIVLAQNATRDLLFYYQENPERYQFDLSSEEAMRKYYASLYGSMKKGSQNYPLRSGGDLLDYLSINEKYAEESVEHIEDYILRQAFRLAGDSFQVFDENTHTVVVPYGEAKKYIRELDGETVRKDIKRQKQIIEKLKPFCISIIDYRYRQLLSEGGILTVCDGMIEILSEALYDEEIGLCSHGMQIDDYFV